MQHQPEAIMSTIHSRVRHTARTTPTPRIEDRSGVSEERVKRAMARVEAFQNIDIGAGPLVQVLGMRLDSDGAVRVRLPPDALDIKSPLDLAHAMLIAEGVTSPVLKLEDPELTEEMLQCVKAPQGGSMGAMSRADRVALRLLDLDEPVTKQPAPAQCTSPTALLIKQKTAAVEPNPPLSPAKRLVQDRFGAELAAKMSESLARFLSLALIDGVTPDAVDSIATAVAEALVPWPADMLGSRRLKDVVPPDVAADVLVALQRKLGALTRSGSLLAAAVHVEKVATKAGDAATVALLAPIREAGRLPPGFL
jgi:hypothetical protein